MNISEFNFIWLTRLSKHSKLVDWIVNIQVGFKNVAKGCRAQSDWYLVKSREMGIN